MSARSREIAEEAMAAEKAVIAYERIEVTLRDGTLVLGKLHKGDPCAKTYANRTQAQRAADKEPGAFVIGRYPFFVRLP